MKLNDQIKRLTELAEKIRDRNLPEIALRESVFDLIYVLKRIKELYPNTEVDTVTANQNELIKYSESRKALRVYSQCLLLWSSRILEILKKIANIEIPSDVNLARNILAAHFGSAWGNLLNLTKENGFALSGYSPGGVFQYIIASIGSPASTASNSEREVIQELHKKYCTEEKVFNPWFACFQILSQEKIKVCENDFKKIERFVHNNGGLISDSQRTVDCVIDSIEKYLAAIKL